MLSAFCMLSIVLLQLLKIILLIFYIFISFYYFPLIISMHLEKHKLKQIYRNPTWIIVRQLKAITHSKTSV